MSEPSVARYFCHMCDRMVNPIMDAEIKCPYCEEGFLEEMDGREEAEDDDLTSDRALSLWAPILLGMMGRRRRYHRREEYDDESDQDREFDTVLRRGRRNPAAVFQLLQSPRAERLLESSNSENEGRREREREGERDRDRDRDRNRDRESLILINPFNQAIIVQGSFDTNQNQNSNAPSGASLGDYFVGPGLEMLLQHLAETDPNRYGTPPAKKEAVEAMPTVKVEECSGCPVCLEDFDIGTEAKEMPCNHRFHTGCIIPWLELHSSCPVCRSLMPADESKDSNMATTNGNRSESTSGAGSDDGGNGGSGNRFWVPFQWPFNGLFSSSNSQRNGNSGSSSSSSSSPASGNNPHTDEN